MRNAWRYVLVLLLGCSPEYELLRRTPAGESGSAGMPSAGGEPSDIGGTDAGGASAGSSTGGAATGGTGALGGAALGGTGTGGNCGNHLDCGLGTVCSGSQCISCPEVPAACAGPCDHGFQPVLAEYNGCAVCECAPVSQCITSADCAAGEQCYAGTQCEPGCSDPVCCKGNQCSRVGCEGQPVPHCLAAGCAGGALCLAACSAVSCECDGTSWQCAESPSSGGAPGESCPQACVSP